MTAIRIAPDRQKMARRLLKKIAFAFALFLAHAALAHQLDRMDIVARLLSPHGDILFPLAASAVFYALRFVLFFYAPGSLIAEVVFAVWLLKTQSTRA